LIFQKIENKKEAEQNFVTLLSFAGFIVTILLLKKARLLA